MYWEPTLNIMYCAPLGDVPNVTEEEESGAQHVTGQHALAVSMVILVLSWWSM